MCIIINLTCPVSFSYRAYAVAGSLGVLFHTLCYSHGLVMFASYDKRGCDPLKTGIRGNQVPLQSLLICRNS